MNRFDVESDVPVSINPISPNSQGEIVASLVVARCLNGPVAASAKTVKKSILKKKQAPKIQLEKYTDLVNVCVCDLIPTLKFT